MKKLILLMMSLAAITSCIDNDIPFPVIKGDVLTIKFDGQREAKVDATKRTITLVLNDTVDLRSVEILEFGITDDSRASIAVGDKLDFSQGSGLYAVAKDPFKFTVSTYQDYEWQIFCTQEIDYHFDVSGGIGEAEFDRAGKVVTVKVPDDKIQFPLTAVMVEDYQFAPAGAIYAPDPAQISDYSALVKIKVTFFGIEQEWLINVEPSKENVITGAVNAWTMFAIVSGTVQSTATGDTGFEYRKKSETEWKYIKADRNGGKISAAITGLSPNTDYVFRARLGEELAAEAPFRTTIVANIDNMGFEDWFLLGTTQLPGADQDPDKNYWATGNPGVTMKPIPGKPSNTEPSTDSHGGKLAAKIKTVAVPLVNLAAGSLFTGWFKTDMGTPLNSTKFSRPYAARPTSLSFWYKYEPKAINITAADKTNLKGTMDKCNIYIYLGDWQGELLASQLRPDDPSKTPGAIAYGAFSTDKAVSSYTRETIKLKFFDVERPVTRIIIVASSSIYGDFYTGGEGSTLMLDDLEFGWDYPEGGL